MDEVLLEFQKDLQAGMSIQKACEKHQVTFKYACDALLKQGVKKKKPKKPRKKITKSTGELYIQQRNDHFYLRKLIRGKIRMFGTYKSLEDAVRMREYCNENGWKQKSIDKYCEILGIERCKHHTNTVKYS